MTQLYIQPMICKGSKTKSWFDYNFYQKININIDTMYNVQKKKLKMQREVEKGKKKEAKTRVMSRKKRQKRNKRTA